MHILNTIRHYTSLGFYIIRKCVRALETGREASILWAFLSCFEASTNNFYISRWCTYVVFTLQYQAYKQNCLMYTQKGKNNGHYGWIYFKVSTMQSPFEQCLLLFALSHKTRFFEHCLLLFALLHKTRSSTVYCSLLYNARRRIPEDSIILQLYKAL